MAVSISVGLLSGEKVAVLLTEGSSVDELRKQAQRSLRVSIAQLITASGEVLQRPATLQEACIKDGDSLTAVVGQPAVAAALNAFAAIRADGSVVAWGGPPIDEDESGDPGNCTAVQSQLQRVTHIQAAYCAFAALREDGSVVTWGDDVAGGDSSSVQDQLYDVCSLQSSMHAFAALKKDGSVVTWGLGLAGDSTSVRGQLHDVRAIQSDENHFAALRADGVVVYWGDYANKVGFEVLDLLRDVLWIQGSLDGFAAVKAKGKLVFFGVADPDFGDIFPRGEKPGDTLSSVHETGLPDVCHLQFCRTCWAAASQDGKLATFGPVNSTLSSLVACPAPHTIGDVVGIQSYARYDLAAFAAIRRDGSVVTWGDGLAGGDSSAVQNELKNVVQVQAAGSAFAALRTDGSVVTWGRSDAGDSRRVQAQLKNITSIQTNGAAFAALRADGSVITWGSRVEGGDSSLAQGLLQDVTCIQASNAAFAAIRVDGSIVTWGRACAGACSKRVREELGRTEAATGPQLD